MSSTRGLGRVRPQTEWLRDDPWAPPSNVQAEGRKPTNQCRVYPCRKHRSASRLSCSACAVEGKFPAAVLTRSFDYGAEMHIIMKDIELAIAQGEEPRRADVGVPGGAPRVQARNA